MPDVAQFDVDSSPLIVYAVKTNNPKKRQILSIVTDDNLSLQSNKKLKVSSFKNNQTLSKNFD
jgi:hypothetical protein